jgi:hypothetical protein
MAMLDLIKNPQKRARQAAEAFRFVAENDWNSAKTSYLTLVDSLTAKEPRT